MNWRSATYELFKVPEVQRMNWRSATYELFTVPEVQHMNCLQFLEMQHMNGLKFHEVQYMKWRNATVGSNECKNSYQNY